MAVARRTFTVAVGLSLAAGAASAGPDDLIARACTTPAVMVVAPKQAAADPEDVCAAAAISATFFAAAGLGGPTRVVIRLVDETTSFQLEPDEAGRYDGASSLILVPTFAAATARQTTTGAQPPWSKEQWRGHIVHELAHATVHPRCDTSCPNRAIHEYVAAVAQIESLPAAAREALLAGYQDVEGFASPVEISEIYYAMNPQQFGVKAYKHFRNQPDPPASLRRLLFP